MSSISFLIAGLQQVKLAEVKELVKSGNMEKMAELVLEGQGELLLDQSSDNPDVQLFLNNIPQYMGKIETVHRAAREGDLRGVQTSLDRRKFAVARDNATALKPTPLHVATLFGRTSVLRYLAGRFPETMHEQDANGRTPLHYAAALPDNGHFYSLLVTLGADKAITDKEGKTAEHYLQNKEELTLPILMKEYQKRSNKIANSGLNVNQYSDKGAEIIKAGYPVFAPEEGQYLAHSLGEPLIKGLTEVAQIRPKDPIVHLANFLLSFSKGGKLPEAITDGADKDKDGDNDKDKDEEKKDEGKEKKDDGDEEQDNKNKDGDEEADDGPAPGESNGLDGDKASETAFKPISRDEHGQSMLHFACARSHGRNALYQLLQEMDANVGLRDEMYRTARDIAEQVNLPDNVTNIDKYVVALAARGENDKLNELLLEGYDHILDAEDEGDNITEIVKKRGNQSTLDFLRGIPSFEERREKLHRAIRFGTLSQVTEALRGSRGKNLALAKNAQSRCSLHIAVLAQHEGIVEHIASKYKDTLTCGDNMNRTPLHYAMGVEKVEILSKILIAAGAERVAKDLNGRQPSYYFMNKTDIQKLVDEEEALRV